MVRGRGDAGTQLRGPAKQTREGGCRDPQQRHRDSSRNPCDSSEKSVVYGKRGRGWYWKLSQRQKWGQKLKKALCREQFCEKDLFLGLQTMLPVVRATHQTFQNWALLFLKLLSGHDYWSWSQPRNALKWTCIFLIFLCFVAQNHSPTKGTPWRYGWF